MQELSQLAKSRGFQEGKSKQCFGVTASGFAQQSQGLQACQQKKEGRVFSLVWSPDGGPWDVVGSGKHWQTRDKNHKSFQCCTKTQIELKEGRLSDKQQLHRASISQLLLEHPPKIYHPPPATVALCFLTVRAVQLMPKMFPPIFICLSEGVSQPFSCAVCACSVARGCSSPACRHQPPPCLRQPLGVTRSATAPRSHLDFKRH